MQRDIDGILAVIGCKDNPVDDLDDREWEDVLARTYEPEQDPVALVEDLEDMGKE
jgi:hypothetical protein